jgi:hypothetical protein
MRFATFSLFFLYCIALSCKYKQNDKPSQDQFEFYPAIPDTAKYKNQIIKQIEEESNFFNLSSLINGSTDSVEIRVWPSHAFNLFKNSFVFKCQKNQWYGYRYFSYTMPLSDINGHINNYKDSQKIGNSVFLIKRLTPLSGWDSFSDSLAFFKIQTLPTQSLIPNFKDKLYLDGSWVTIEIATSKSYRRISYANPSGYEHEECKKITSFLNYLYRQSGNLYKWENLL